MLIIKKQKQKHLLDINDFWRKIIDSISSLMFYLFKIALLPINFLKLSVDTKNMKIHFELGIFIPALGKQLWKWSEIRPALYYWSIAIDHLSRAYNVLRVRKTVKWGADHWLHFPTLYFILPFTTDMANNTLQYRVCFQCLLSSIKTLSHIIICI